MEPNELQQADKNQSRILARQVAVEMTADEIDQVSGGDGPNDFTESGGDCDKPINTPP